METESPGVHKVWEGGNFILRHIYQPAGTFDKVKQRPTTKTQHCKSLSETVCFRFRPNTCISFDILNNYDVNEINIIHTQNGQI